MMEGCRQMLFEQALHRRDASRHNPGLPHESVSLLEVPAAAIVDGLLHATRVEGKPVWYLVPDGVVQPSAQIRSHRFTTQGET